MCSYVRQASHRASWEEEKAAAVAAVSQQSHPSHKPLNGWVTPPFDMSSGFSVARLSCKSVGCILDRKNRLIVDEQILNVSSEFLE